MQVQNSKMDLKIQCLHAEIHEDMTRHGSSLMDSHCKGGLLETRSQCKETEAVKLSCSPGSTLRCIQLEKLC